MAKRKKRRSKFRGAKRGKRAFCRTFVASNCSVKIGSRRYKAGKSCPTGKVKVCPLKRGRKTRYKLITATGWASLRKVAARRRRR